MACPSLTTARAAMPVRTATPAPTTILDLMPAVKITEPQAVATQAITVRVKEAQTIMVLTTTLHHPPGQPPVQPWSARLLSQMRLEFRSLLSLAVQGQALRRRATTRLAAGDPCHRFKQAAMTTVHRAGGQVWQEEMPQSQVWCHSTQVVRRAGWFTSGSLP